MEQIERRANEGIWAFQAELSERLLVWGAVSTAAGALLAAVGDAFWRGFGTQTAGWGAVDAGIALFGAKAAEKRRAQPASGSLETRQREARNLRRLLWINAGLDVLYIAGGAITAATKGERDAKWRGHGVGVIVQGAFLLLFDVIHALTAPEA